MNDIEHSPERYNTNKEIVHNELGLDELITNNQQLTNSRWIKVKDLSPGMEIAVPNENADGIKFVKIKEINVLEEQHVYDLAIENTYNFIANDIVAHNTYIGNLVLASDSISTNNITSKSRNISFYNDTGSEIMKIDGGNARVGIGTTTLNALLTKQSIN